MFLAQPGIFEKPHYQWNSKIWSSCWHWHNCFTWNKISCPLRLYMFPVEKRMHLLVMLICIVKKKKSLKETILTEQATVWHNTKWNLYMVFFLTFWRLPTWFQICLHNSPTTLKKKKNKHFVRNMKMPARYYEIFAWHFSRLKLAVQQLLLL